MHANKRKWAGAVAPLRVVHHAGALAGDPLRNSISGIRKNTTAVAAADTTISGARCWWKTCSYSAEPDVSDSGPVRLTIDIMPAKAKPSAPSGQDSAARDMVAIMAIMLVMPPTNQIATAV